jgi:hypothetical protein
MDKASDLIEANSSSPRIVDFATSLRNGEDVACRLRVLGSGIPQIDEQTVIAMSETVNCRLERTKNQCTKQ